MEDNTHTDKRDRLIEKQGQDLREHKTRLVMAYAFIDLLRTAYSALLHHGVNYQTLPEYKRDSPLDDLTKHPIEDVKMRAIKWMERVKHDIEAHVRRKGFRLH